MHTPHDTHPITTPDRPPAAPRTRMTAIVQRVYGTADVLRLEEIDVPEIAEDEVLVRVHAAAVDRGVAHLMTGLPYPIRLAGYGLRTPKNPVPGRDLSGVVEAVGGAVTRFRAGDEVMGIGHGSFAELTRAPEHKLVHKPGVLSFQEAAALPISGLTALKAIRDVGQVMPGQEVLVTGASGGVGTYAVQLAVALGARVTGVCSTTKTDLVRAIGASEVIDYTQDDFADGPRRYDVIIDIGGNATLRRLRRALTPRGRLVLVGGENGGRISGGSDRSLRALMWSPFIGQTLRGMVNSENAAGLEVLSTMVEHGQLRPVLDRTFALEDAPQAIRHMEAGRARGKAVIDIRPGHG